MSERLDRIERILENFILENEKSKLENEKFRLETKNNFDKLAESQSKGEKALREAIKETNRNISGFEKTQSNIIEDLFFNSLYTSKILENIKYDTMEKNKNLIIDEVMKTEIDIILYNGSHIAMIEVKEKPKKKYLKHIKKKIEIYRKLHKDDKRIIQGYLASFKFSDLIKEKAIKQNIGLITIKGEILEETKRILENE